MIAARVHAVKDNGTITLYCGPKFMFVDHMYCHTISAIKIAADDCHFIDILPTKTDKFHFPHLLHEIDYLQIAVSLKTSIKYSPIQYTKTFAIINPRNK